MFTTILVPLDGSSLAECAIPYAEALAARSNARLELVRAETSGITGSRVTVIHEALAYLEKIASGLRARGVMVGTHAPYGAPTAGVIAEARRLAADLIVMASHGRSGFGHLAYGSIAEEILDRAPAPVLLVSARPESSGAATMMGAPRLLVPLDGSIQAEYAIPLARELATTFDGSIVLLQALEPQRVGSPVPSSEAWPDMSEEARKREVAALEYLHAVASQDLAGVATLCVVRTGSPAAVIAAVYPDYGVTMVVMATHGNHGLARFFFGSVAADALHAVSSPFLLIGPSVEVVGESGSRSQVPS